MLFKDVVEQEHVVRTLKNSVSEGRIAHAYLFCGTRGTGKTTMAKILSRAVNCLEPKDGDPCNTCEICTGIAAGSILDVVEIDAASNNSVDNIRDLRDEVIYSPSKARYKVYIIDEVHMLSTGAFNALLKTLEEPPPHVVFILATTEPHKLPGTILSRCQRFDFRRIPVDSIAARVEFIAGESGIKINRDASKLIARLSDGALRDAISILDQCMSLGNKELAFDDVLGVVGMVNDTFIADVVDAVKNSEIQKILNLIEHLVMEGKNISQFVSELILYYRNLLICSSTDKPHEIIEASSDTVKKMKSQSEGYKRHEIMAFIKELSELEAGLRWSAHPRILLEIALIKLCERNVDFGDAGIIGRLEKLEETIGNIVSVSNKDTANLIRRNENREIRPETPAKSVEDTCKPSQKDGGKTAGSMKGLEVWAEVLKELKNNGRMGLYTNLLDTKVIEISNKVVGLVFSNTGSINKLYVSKPENMEVVEACLGKCLGRDIKIKCIGEDEMVTERKTEEEKDELLEKAQDIACRLNTKLNIIDG